MNVDPIEEQARLAVLAEYPIDQARSAKLDRVARLAAQICETPIAAISLVYEDRQVFVGRTGLADDRTPREQSFCGHAMRGHGCMLISNALEDPRFADNPLVLNDPAIRFYAGHPLVSPEGQPLGAICVIDRVPREGLTPEQLLALETLGEMVMALLESWREEEQNRTASHLSRSVIAELEQRFGVLADALPQMVWMTNPDGNSVYFSRQWCEYTGRPAEDSYGAKWLDMLHPEDAPGAAQAWQQAVAARKPYETRYRLRSSAGAYRWVVARGLPLFDGSGEIVRWVGTCTDINDEMESADALELLSHELNHRIKNTFAVISGLVGLSARAKPEAADFAKDLSARVLSLSRAHSFAVSRGGRSDVIVASGLGGLISELLAPYILPGSDKIAVTGDDPAVSERSATPLALVIHELATNSAKYGAIIAPEGKLSVAIADGEEVRITWSESGIGPVSAPTREGFGSRLIGMSIERQLGGKIATEWHDNALKITLSIPRANLSAKN